MVLAEVHPLHLLVGTVTHRLQGQHTDTDDAAFMVFLSPVFRTNPLDHSAHWLETCSSHGAS